MVKFTLFILFSCTIVIYLAYIILNWWCHVSVSERNSYGWAGFKSFKKEFNKHKWTCYDFKNDRLYEDDSEITSSYMKFNGVYMIINNPISYHLAMKYVIKYIKSNFMKKYDWNKPDIGYNNDIVNSKSKENLDVALDKLDNMIFEWKNKNKV